MLCTQNIAGDMMQQTQMQPSLGA